MFEPTHGCPHLQPLELMQKAEQLAVSQKLNDEQRLKAEVLVTEVVPDHMFKCIKTTLTWSGSAWQISNIDRILELGSEEPSETLILKD